MTRFYRINGPTAQPSKAYEGDAGYDLFSSERHLIRPGVITPVHTGWGVRLRLDEFGMICPRSGLAFSGVTVVNAPGIIDSGYTGEIIVLLTSLAQEVEILPGMAVAQMVISTYRDQMSGPTREDKGFGSSDGQG